MTVGIDTVKTSALGTVLFQGSYDQVIAYLQANPPTDDEIVVYGSTNQPVFATEYMVNPPQ